MVSVWKAKPDTENIAQRQTSTQMNPQGTFHLGETVVYAMHGMGQVTAILHRSDDGPSARFYQITLEGKAGGKVLVPVASAQTLGLRRALRAAEVS